MQSLPIIKKAFLATKNVTQNFYLLTERVESQVGDSFLFYLIEAKNEKIGQKILHQLNSDIAKKLLSSDYFSLMQFEECLQSVNKNLSSQNLLSSANDSVNVIIGFCEQNLLHLSMTGSVEGYLMRKGKINSLTEGLGNNQEFGFYNITSGELSSQDMVIIGNKNFFDRLSLDRIRRTLSLYSPKLAIRDFFQLLKKTKKTDCNAIVLQSTSLQQSDSEDSNLPDFIYLDEIEVSAYQQLLKKLTPRLKAWWSVLSSNSKRLASKTDKIAKTTAEKWQNNYGPRTKEFLAKTGRNTQSGIKNLSGNIEKSYSSRKNGVKVKSYNNTTGKNSFALFLATLVGALRQITLAARKKENRKYLYAAAIVLLVFFSYLKIVSNNENRDVIKQQNDAQYAVEQAAETLKTANEDISLGRSNGLDKLKTALDFANTGLLSADTESKAKEIKNEILAKMDEITKTNRLYNQTPIFSFSNQISVSAISGSVLYGITGDGKIYSTDSRDKDPRLINAIDTTSGNPLSAFYSDTTNLLYILTSKPSVWAFDPLSQSIAELLINDGSAWESGIAISAYSSNIYILDAIQGKIWRHSKDGDRYGPGTSYAKANDTNSKEGVSIAIDGSVYVLKANGAIAKFSQSTLDSSFSIKSPPEPDAVIINASQIFTDADSQNTFILDKNLNRVLRYTKNGEFVDQFIIDNITVSSFLVNPRLQKLWIISDKDVFEIDL